MNILDRINKALTQSIPTRNEHLVQEAERLANVLSGAFHQTIRVKVHEGRFYAFVPVSSLRTSGVTVAESAIPNTAPILVGSTGAVANAERRVSKCIKDYAATLRTFDPSTQLCSFEVSRAEA